jgi:hypothetical protein
MTKSSKLLSKVLSGRSDTNIDFDDLRNLLTNLGFIERIGGSHHVFVRTGVEDLINSSGRVDRQSLTRCGRVEL